jgi:hypothetical protein
MSARVIRRRNLIPTRGTNGPVDVVGKRDARIEEDD